MLTVTRNQVPALVLSATAIAVLAALPNASSVSAYNGCPGDLVPRNARPGDQVCVTKQVAIDVAREDDDPAAHREPNGGAYGPMSCQAGYVWREAFVGDSACVKPERRQQSWDENRAAGTGPTGQGEGASAPRNPVVSATSPEPVPGGGCMPHCLPSTSVAAPIPPAPPPPGVPSQLPLPLPQVGPTATTTTVVTPTKTVSVTPTTVVTPTTTVSVTTTGAPPPKPCNPNVDVCVK